MLLERLRESSLARAFYRLVAWLTAQLLGLTGGFQSILVHRSVATGELRFGESDIDLLLVLKEEALEGPRLERLQRQTQMLKALNPALHHLKLFRPGGIPHFARLDSAWGEFERRSSWGVYGRPVELPPAPLNSEHSIRRFLIGWELHLSRLLRDGSPRNKRKVALDCWHLFAQAQGLLTAPLLTRQEAWEHLAGSEGAPPSEQLHTRSGSARFTLELAGRLHDRRLPALKRLSEPMTLELIVPPFCVPRTFLVLPSAEAPLPPVLPESGLFLATPELLNLFINFRNGFLHGMLPKGLTDLGFQAPCPQRFLRENRYLCGHHFLFHPGFAEKNIPHPKARLHCLRHALSHLREGRLPPPLDQGELRGLSRTVEEVRDYYLYEYPELAIQSDALETEMGNLLDG